MPPVGVANKWVTASEKRPILSPIEATVFFQQS